MGNRNKAKGTKWESEVRDYLNRELGQVDDDGRFYNPADPHNVKRQAQEGRADVGDVWAVPFVLECKNEKSIRLPAYVRQAETEADNAGLPYGVAVVKQRGRGPAHGHVAMSLATFARLLTQVRKSHANTSTTPAEQQR